MIKNKKHKIKGYYKVYCNRGIVLLDCESIKNLPNRTISVHKTLKYAYFKLNGKCHKLHRYLLSISDSQVQIDHKNGNPLDNRLTNLRVCDNQLNCRNRGNKAGSKVPYKGVTVTKEGNYMARIQISKKTRLCLGRFDTPEEAAKAYNKAAIKHHKEFAKLNKI